MMERLGRRNTIIIMLGVGGVACICSGLMTYFWSDLDWSKNAVLALAMIGKMCTAGAYAVIYNYTVEIFPTVVRSSGTSFGSMSGRIGSISAPLLHNLATYVLDWVPIVIYGSIAVLASFLDLFLPETKGREYPETIEDAVHWDNKEYWAAKHCEKNTTSSATKLKVEEVLEVEIEDRK